MAFMELNYRSRVLWRTVTMQVLLPTDMQTPSGEYAEPRRFPTLYLLHGLHGNHNDWLTYTRIRRLSQDLGIAVVMPAGDNSFYVDRPEARSNYGQFIGEELVEMTRRMFPLSHKREDTFLGGLSMGGFGALRNGLKYHDTFSAIISLSGAVDILHSTVLEGFRAFGESVFGPIEEAWKSDKDPRFLMEQLKDEKDKPRIYLSCGTEDYLLPQNRVCRQLLEDAGFAVTYEEAPGAHTWDYWDFHIEKAIAWLQAK